MALITPNLNDELDGNEFDRLLLSLSDEQRFALAEGRNEAAERAELNKEIGRTGTVFFSGFLQKDEYNAKLRGDKAIRIYDEMWHGDGQVRAIVSLCEMPLLMSTYVINPASDDDQDVEIAQFIQDNLIGGGTDRPWRTNLQHILTFLRYGFSAVEPVWTIRDGKVYLKKLAPRLAKTIYRIWANDDDEIDTVEQRVWVQDKNTEGSGSFQYLRIPGNKLMWFTLNREGNDFFGESILRPAYKHWFIKETLYKVDAIGCERQSLGIPVVIEPPDKRPTAAERMATGKALASLHAHQKAWLSLPAGYQFQIAGVTGSTKPVLPSIEHHDNMMARSILAQFLNFSEGGSYAMSANLSALFLQVLEAYAGLVCDTINRHLIRRMVDYNWNVDRYPTITYQQIDQRSMADLVNAATGLFTAGGLTKTLSTENALRKMLSLPELTPEEMEEITARQESLARAGATTFMPAPQAPATSKDVVGDAEAEIETDSTGKAADDEEEGLSDAGDVDGFIAGPYWRDMTPLEKTADLAAVDAGIDQGKLDFLVTVKPIVERQAARFIEVAQRQASRGRLNAQTIDVPFAKDLAAAIYDIEERYFTIGQRTVQAEADKQRGKLAQPIWAEAAEDILLFFRNRADTLTAIMNTKLKANFALMLQPLAGEGDATINVETTTGNILRLAERDIRQAAPTVVIDAISIGRGSQAKALGARKAQYSALLDPNTCPPCGSLDDTTFTVGSTEYNRVMPPYTGCDGGDNCRCVFVYDFLDQD